MERDKKIENEIDWKREILCDNNTTLFNVEIKIMQLLVKIAW